MNHDDISEIVTNLFQSSGPLFSLPRNISAVINLTEINDVFPSKDTQRLKAYLWVPIEDGYFPGIEWLDSVVNSIISFIKLKYPTLVYCMAGISRSTLVTAAYLLKTGYPHMTVDNAICMIRKSRPFINPNPLFLKSLEEYKYFLDN